MLRASRRGAKAGDMVYLIANQWFLQWKKITGYNVCVLAYLCTALAKGLTKAVEILRETGSSSLVGFNNLLLVLPQGTLCELD